MNDQEFEKLLEQADEVHNVPPEVPSERMWQQIQAAAPVAEARPRFRLWQTALATAAVLVIGISIGRWSQPEPSVEMVSAEVPISDTRVSEIYQHTTLALFDRADALLTEFRMEGCTSQQMESTGRWAGNLLTQTRVLQGSPVAQNAELAALLTDLELVLAQIVTINPEHCDRDVAWINSGLTQRATLDRLRAASDRADRLAPL